MREAAQHIQGGEQDHWRGAMSDDRNKTRISWLRLYYAHLHERRGVRSLLCVEND